MEFNDPAGKTEFNSMIAIIYRLDSIHKYCHQAKARRDESQYFSSLHSLFVELIRHLAKGNNKNKDNSEILMDPKIAKHFEMLDNCLKDVNEIQTRKNEGKPIPYNLWKNMFVWHLQLNILEQQSGLGLSYGKDPRFAMGN